MENYLNKKRRYIMDRKSLILEYRELQKQCNELEEKLKKKHSNSFELVVRPYSWIFFLGFKKRARTETIKKFVEKIKEYKEELEKILK